MKIGPVVVYRKVSKGQSRPAFVICYNAINKNILWCYLGCIDPISFKPISVDEKAIRNPILKDLYSLWRKTMFYNGSQSD